MKRIKFSLALLAIVVAVTSAFTTLPKKHKMLTDDYQIFSVSTGALAFPDNTYADYTSSNTAFRLDIGATPSLSDIPDYLDNSGHSCANATNGKICVVEVQTAGTGSVYDQKQGDFQ